MKNIDCLLIGHNEMNFMNYEKIIRLLGTSFEGYRDLNLNYIKYNNQMYTFPEVFNMVCTKSKYNKNGEFNLGNVFSPTITYLGSYLKKNGISFDYINSFQFEMDKLKEKLLNQNILTIGVTTTLYTTVLPIIEIIKYIKKVNSTVKVIVGGPFISTQVKSQSKESLRYIFERIGADFYINSSQGESTLVNLIKYLKGEQNFSQLKNLFYIKNGQLYSTDTEIENNILEENLVEWDLFSKGVKSIIGVRTSISCPFSCSFCGFPENAGDYQTVKVEGMKKEFDGINKLSSVTCVNIIDDTFNVPLKRFKEILKMKIESKYKFKWNSFIRCQYLDEEAAFLMKESGCEGVFLGLESANQQILNNMNKKVRIDEYIKGIKLIKKYEMVSFASFIYGFPGETEESIKDTEEFIIQYKPDFYRIQLWYCEPKTPIWRQKDVYKIEGSQFSWTHLTMNSKTAISYVEKSFLNINESIWLPQYNFDFIGIFNLIHRGLKLSQIKGLIELFNLGVSQKFKSKDLYNVNDELISKMKMVLGVDDERSV